MKSSLPPPHPWHERKPSVLNYCALELTAPSRSHHSNSEVFRSNWVGHKVGQVFTERFQESKSWLGKAIPSMFGDGQPLSVAVSQGSFWEFNTTWLGGGWQSSLTWVTGKLVHLTIICKGLFHYHLTFPSLSWDFLLLILHEFWDVYITES